MPQPGWTIIVNGLFHSWQCGTLSFGILDPVDSMQTQNLHSCRRCWLTSTPRAVTRAHGRVTRLRVVSENCLIVNTNSGAHAFIGLHLAHALLKKNHKVTILNNGDQVNQMHSTTCQHSPVSTLF